MKVQEIMTSEVQSCSPENDLATAATMMWNYDCGCVPVVDGEGQVIGMVTDRDICMAVATRLRTASEITVGEVMTGEVHACAPDEDVKNALDVMREKKLRRLPVVATDGALIGILSINDVVLHAEKGAGKHHVAHKDVMATLKTLCAHRAPQPASARARAGE